MKHILKIKESIINLNTVKCIDVEGENIHIWFTDKGWKTFSFDCEDAAKENFSVLCKFIKDLSDDCLEITEKQNDSKNSNDAVEVAPPYWISCEKHMPEDYNKNNKGIIDVIVLWNGDNGDDISKLSRMLIDGKWCWEADIDDDEIVAWCPIPVFNN